MQTGVYRKIKGRTGVGQLYEFDCLCRHHTTGIEMVVYIPLRVEPEWAGTVRHCVLERAAFNEKFEYVGEGLPPSSEPVGWGDKREKYPCLSTLEGSPKCMFCGRPWAEIVHMLKKYKRWEKMPDCPKRPKEDA